MRELVLASASPRRRMLLSRWGFSFRVIPSSIRENVRFRSPRQLAEKLSAMKAEAVRKRASRDSVIVASDLVVSLKGKIFGKPIDALEAVRMLKRLSGRTHRIFCGVTVLDNPSGRRKTGCVSAKITFKKLSDEEILRYVSTGEPNDKAGAYAIQGKGRRLIAKIQGELSAIIGLSKQLTLKYLRETGIRPGTGGIVRVRTGP
ncbi:MAG: nucleoside triphosphate pyrophosphatase [archaeon]